MNEEEQRAMLLDFERNRQMLGSITAQKQQLTIQLEVTKTSLDELKNTKEKSVYKIVGNILVPKSVTDMEKELKERQETIDLRLKTVEKQEETILKKLNAIRAKIEGPKEDEEEKESKEDKKSDKKKK
ncbi:MAG: prefoldin subunit [archaeon]